MLQDRVLSQVEIDPLERGFVKVKIVPKFPTEKPGWSCDFTKDEKEILTGFLDIVTQGVTNFGYSIGTVSHAEGRITIDTHKLQDRHAILRFESVMEYNLSLRFLLMSSIYDQKGEFKNMMIFPSVHYVDYRKYASSMDTIRFDADRYRSPVYFSDVLALVFNEPEMMRYQNKKDELRKSVTDEDWKYVSEIIKSLSNPY